MNADIPARKRDARTISHPGNLRMISLSGKDANCVMSPGNRFLLQWGQCLAAGREDNPLRHCWRGLPGASNIWSILEHDLVNLWSKI